MNRIAGFSQFDYDRRRPCSVRLDNTTHGHILANSARFPPERLLNTSDYRVRDVERARTWTTIIAIISISYDMSFDTTQILCFCLIFLFFFYDIIYASVGTDDPKDAVVLYYSISSAGISPFTRDFDPVDAINRKYKKKKTKTAYPSPSPGNTLVL